MICFEEIATRIKKELSLHPICVETGTAYFLKPNDPYWNTTSAIVKRICEPLDGYLYSVDILDRTSIIKELFRLGNTDISRITLMQGNSPDVLSSLHLSHIDLLCLDSGENEDLLVDEFKAVEHLLAEKHYVLVDDIHNQNSIKYKKIVPLLKTMNYIWKEYATETGLFVAVKGYNLP
jgi:hypothetical protein